jgi:hypothetical protein
VAGGNDSKAAGGRKQKGKQREENGAKHKPKQLKAKAEHAGAAGSMGRRKKDQGKAPSPAAPPAAAAGVLETSGASGSGAVAPAAADGATARSTDAAPAVAAVVVAAADASGKGGKGKKPFAGRQGPAALQGSVLEVPARRRMGEPGLLLCLLWLWLCSPLGHLMCHLAPGFIVSFTIVLHCGSVLRCAARA